jgi:hypothetical protein
MPQAAKKLTKKDLQEGRGGLQDRRDGLMAKPKCKHDREPDQCEQCRFEALSDEGLLDIVEEYAGNLRKHGFIPRGWWIELARRLRESKEVEKWARLSLQDHKFYKGLADSLEGKK